MIKVLDLETETIHDLISFDRDKGYVVMESLEYGRTRNSIDKVRIFEDSTVPERNERSDKKISSSSD